MSDRLSLYDLVGDLVLYRNLDPVDPRLPRFAEAWTAMGLADGSRPRKHEPAYARATAWYLRRARELDRPRTLLTELVYLGDTAMSDGGAFRNLQAVGADPVRGESGWRGWAFIGAEKDTELAITEQDGIYLANRWTALARFAAALLDEQRAALDERTAVIVDVDKTALGARGRNDGAIDRARVTAIEATVADALGPAFDQGTFRRAYAALNVPRYHPFTADNQDYVAYVCLMISAGFIAIDDLLAQLEAGSLTSFREFIAQVQAAQDRLPAEGLRSLHGAIFARVRAGDPTPFKAFRRREYRETVERMGHLPDAVPLAQRLVEEICLTLEVVEFVRWLQRRGCLLLALSDKPDEATMPLPQMVAHGYLPLHRTPTHVVGQSITALLPD